MEAAHTIPRHVCLPARVLHEPTGFRAWSADNLFYPRCEKGIELVGDLLPHLNGIRVKAAEYKQYKDKRQQPIARKSLHYTTAMHVGFLRLGVPEFRYIYICVCIYIYRLIVCRV